MTRSTEMGLSPVWRLRSVEDVPEHIQEPRGDTIQEMSWLQLKAKVAGCTDCKLRADCTQTVFGVGRMRKPGWLMVGEAPGRRRICRGEPFVGQAGRLLDNMLAAIGCPEPGTTSISPMCLECRPPGNRNPEPAEVAKCEPYLKRQIELLIQPTLILAWGGLLSQALVGTDATIAQACAAGCHRLCWASGQCRSSSPIIRRTCCAICRTRPRPGRPAVCSEQLLAGLDAVSRNPPSPPGNGS